MVRFPSTRRGSIAPALALFVVRSTAAGAPSKTTGAAARARTPPGSAHCVWRRRENPAAGASFNANTTKRVTCRQLGGESSARQIGSRPSASSVRERVARPLQASQYTSPNTGLANPIIHAPCHHYQPMLVQKSLLGAWASVQERLFGTAARNDLPEGKQPGTGERFAKVGGLDERGHKRVTIRACGELYQVLTKTRPILYSGAPTQGIQFDVQYYDSLELLPVEQGQGVEKKPLATVCLLHGAPGHYSEFASLIGYLALQGIRVVAPNFPDYDATYEHSFRHSPRERREFLLEFFRAIRVHELDMLIGHSSAVYTMFELLEFVHLNDGRQSSASASVRTISSLGLFSTPSYRLPRSMAVTPLRLFTLKLFDYPLLRPLILACLLTFVKLQGIRNRVDRNKIEDLLIAASAVGYSEHEKMAGRLGLLTEHRIPVLVVYGTKDRLIRESAFRQLEEDLGVKSGDAIRCYRSDGTFEGESSRERTNDQQLVDVCRFESGGHYTFQRYARQVNEEVHRFLSKWVLSQRGAEQEQQPRESDTTRL